MDMMQMFRIEEINDFIRLNDQVDWINRTGITVSELDFFLNDKISKKAKPSFEDSDILDRADELINLSIGFLVKGESLLSDEIKDLHSAQLLSKLNSDKIVDENGLLISKKLRDLFSKPDPDGIFFQQAINEIRSFFSDDKALLLELALTEEWSTLFRVFDEQLQFQLSPSLLEQNLLDDKGIVQGTLDDKGKVTGIDLSKANLAKLIPAATPDLTVTQKLFDDIKKLLEERIRIQEGLIANIYNRITEVLQNSYKELQISVIDILVALIDGVPPLIRVIFDHFIAEMSFIDFWLMMKNIQGDSNSLGNHKSYFAKFSKLVFLFNEFEFSVSEAKALLGTPEIFSVSDVLHPTIKDLTNLHHFRELVDTFNDGEDRLLQLLRDSDQINEDLSALTGWKVKQIETLINHFNSIDPVDNKSRYNRIAGILRLHSCFSISDKLLTDIDFPIQLSNNNSTALDFKFYKKQSFALFNLLHAQYDEDSWKKVYTPMHDALAIYQRDALTSKTMLQLGDHFKGRLSPDVLYEFLLIDVQMGSETFTSRIVQANASIQLYVQRCLMNLEKGVSPDTIPTKQWEWMKNYRVWEANRKVFLYPENFIEPELRDSKSPFFEELEQELMQGDINKNAVEKAYISYLDKFAEVANLKIAGSYFYKKSETENILYLIGRTTTSPKIYYYRELLNGVEWLPWKKIGLTIDVDFVTPVFAFNKLFLLWPEITKLIKSVDRKRRDGSIDKDRNGIIQKENIKVFNSVIKYSYYNFDKTWVQPQTYLEIDRDLDEQTIVQPEWQRVYAQRIPKLLPGKEGDLGIKVLDIDGLTDIKRPIPRNFNMHNLTWSFWVMVDNFTTNAAKEEKDIPIDKIVLFDYKSIQKSFIDHIHVDIELDMITTFRATVTNRVAEIPGAKEKEKTAKTNLENAETENKSAIAALPIAEQIKKDADTVVDNFKKAEENADKAFKKAQEDFDNSTTQMDAAALALGSKKKELEKATTDLVAKQGIATTANSEFIAAQNRVNTAAADEIQSARAALSKADKAKKDADTAVDNAKKAKENAGEAVNNAQKDLENVTAQMDAAALVLDAKKKELEKATADLVVKEDIASTANSAFIAAQDRVDTAAADVVAKQAAYDIEKEADKFHSPDVIVEFEWSYVIDSDASLDFLNLSLDAESKVSKTEKIGFGEISIPIGEWRHLAVTMKYDGSGYEAQLFVNDNNDPGNTLVKSASWLFKMDLGFSFPNFFGHAGKIKIQRQFPFFPKGEVRLGKQSSFREVLFSTKMSEFRIWNHVRAAGDIEIQKLKRQNPQDNNLFYLPLDSPLPNANILLTLALDLPIVPLGIDPETIKEERDIIQREHERILLFYGDFKKSLRNNLDDQQFVFEQTELSSSGSSGNYDINLSLSTLHLTKTDNFSLNDFATPTDSSVKRYSGDTLQYLIKALESHQLSTREEIILRKAITDLNNSEDAFEKANHLVKGLPKFETEVADVHNLPGSYILNTGDEQFLIDLQVDSRDTAEDRLVFTYDWLTLLTDKQRIFLSFKDDPNLEFKEQKIGNVDTLLAGSDGDKTPLKFKFTRLSTYAVHGLSKALFRGGLDELLSLNTQLTEEVPFAQYNHNPKLVIPPPQLPSSKGKDTVDFKGANGLYYQEVFFHIPFFIANALNTNQKFKEAQQWYHYIFNPTAQADPTEVLNTANDRYWRYLPFRNIGLQTMEQLLSDEAALKKYHEDPFDPHAIAALRLNTYQKAIVMKYIDNLLDWGDSLFRRDTRESINEASTLYVIAFNLLGARPEARANQQLPVVGNYNSVRAENPAETPEFLAQFEEVVQDFPTNGLNSLSPHSEMPFQFCIIENEQFMDYWTKVEDRLFKIRHSLNFEGIFRSLALFEPPIDPAALVKAVAGGRDIGSVLSLASGGVPHYRYGLMIQKAKEMTNSVMALGNALLSTLEKKNAEDLTLLLSQHEQNILNLVKTVKAEQVKEAKINLDSLQFTLASAQARKDYYQGLFDGGLSALEITQQVFMALSLALKTGVIIARSVGAGVSAIPDVTVGGSGFGGSPIATISYGGKTASRVSRFVSGALEVGAEISSGVASMTGINAGYERRKEDWGLQANLAGIDINQINKQIEAARVRIQIAEQEVKVHKKQTEQVKEVEDFHKRKFTNAQLYNWMIGRISGLYFQTYKIAYDMALAAQSAFQYELTTNDTYVNFGHWDGLKKGLLAGESLMLDLNRMEKAYLEKNFRRLEIERTISLLQMNPRALWDLKTTGKCDFELSERFFDQDFPGHYCRQIKSLSITIPAVVGPYQNVKAMLSQSINKTVLEPDIESVQFLLGKEGVNEPDSSKLRVNWRANQQIAISRGVNDSGMFELNFNNERYLPFEGTGVISHWRLEMPKATNTFDFDSISDVIINLNYTAKSDGGSFKKLVQEEEAIKRFTGHRVLSMAHEYASAWHQFVNSEESSPQLSFKLPHGIFPHNLKKGVDITQVVLMYELKDGSQRKEGLKLDVFTKGTNGDPSLKFNLGNPLEARTATEGESPVSYDFDRPWIIQESSGKPLDDISNLLILFEFEGDLNF